MNWDAIGAIGQVLGSVAVFVTLGYLAVQVRHARQEVRRSNSRTQAEASRESLAGFRDPGVNELMSKAVAAELAGESLGKRSSAYPFVAHAMDRWGMTPAEAYVLLNIFMSVWSSRLHVIPYVEELSEMEQHEFRLMTRMVYGAPGPQRVFYQLYIKPTQHPDAIRYVDNLLAQPE